VSRKEEILRRAAELKREEESRKSLPPERPYSPNRMTSRMPLGCWIVLLVLAAVAFYAFKRFVVGVH